MAAFTRNGYGQVEANQLSGQKTGQIYASLPLDKNVTVLQNGEFMYYSYADGMVTAQPTKGAITEPYLVFNEVKLYEEPYRTTYKDFAMIRVGENYVTSKLATEGYGDGAETASATIATHTEYPYRMDGIAPRMIKTNIGDIITTNMVKVGGEYAVGDILQPVYNETSKTMVLTNINDLSTEVDGEMTYGGTGGGISWQVVKVYTMPDGQPGLKLQRVQ